jgi:hypothetical protein
MKTHKTTIKTLGARYSQVKDAPSGESNDK